jgi:GNAT superfamily N-acetyltransferase
LSQQPTEFERFSLTLPPWPKEIAAIRRASFPSWFTASYSPMARYGSWMVAATRGGRYIGYAQTVGFAGDRQICVLEEVAVLPDHRHLGLGKNLIVDTARWMNEVGYVTMQACPLHDGDQLIRAQWFQSLGFTRIGSSWHAPTEALALLAE